MNDFNINNFKASLFLNELEKEKNHYKKSLTELKNEFLNYYNILEKKEAAKEKIKELLKEFNTYYKEAIINEL
jgi:butyrate kinase